ncbi:MAG: hypothetical protein ABIP64_17175 [Burkholderiales bacterium]
MAAAIAWLRPITRKLPAGREIAALRVYLRARERHLDYAAAPIQHMQKALTYMNLQWRHVISDGTGITGMRIIRAIVDGQRDPQVLAALRDTRCRASIETVRAALVGNYQPEHLFALKQALERYDFYNAASANATRKSSVRWPRSTPRKQSPRHQCRKRGIEPSSPTRSTLMGVRPCINWSERI